MHYALIRFLNARPLWWGLTQHPSPDDSFEFTSPARCADLLADGLADIGLIPAVELMRIPGLAVVPGFCIASRSEVRSVLLVSRVPLERITSVALDPSSRTSVALARILLGEELGREALDVIRFDPVESHRLLSFEGHDAAVVIGDPALRASRRGELAGLHIYDLVSLWNRRFDEPFVFALWSGRREVIERAGADLEAALSRSLDYGRSQINRIAREASEELQLPYDELLAYFRESLHYEFGEEERRALQRFHALAADYGIVPASPVSFELD